MIEALATAGKEKRSRRLSRLRRLLPSPFPSSSSSSSPRDTRNRVFVLLVKPSRSSWRQVEMVKGGRVQRKRECGPKEKRRGEEKDGASEGERKREKKRIFPR